MKILYISHLSINLAAGLNWSVPASVDAQSHVDDVLWVNMTDRLMPHWAEVKAHHNIREYGGKLESMDVLPTPFNHPDVVVFEGFYYIEDVYIAKMLRKQGVPYIIVPRSSLTKMALHNHAWFKKWVAHKFYFDGFVKHAKAIQYLTQQEAIDSVGNFKTPYFIIPNGFNSPSERKEDFTRNGVKAVFIGRLDMFQKGLDLLLDAISEMKEVLISSHFTIDIYGPRRYDFENIAKVIEKRGLSSIAALHDEIGGDEKKRVLLNADVFVMTSRFEGHPMGLIEALAYGIPCFVTPGSNMAEEIEEHDAGWTCEGTKESIMQGVMQVLKEKESYRKKSQNAVQLAKRYNWAELAHKFHKELERIL